MIPRLAHNSSLEAIYLDFLKALKKEGFEGNLHGDYANRTVASTDNSIYQVLPQGVVYPKNADDIVKLCLLLNEEKYAELVVSPRGGGTGTNAQSLTDGLVVDISKHMNQIIEINPQAGWVRVQAGVVKDQLNAALKPHGLFFAPELSTSNRATIGGMVNTDASGQGSCLYGKTRDHVIELTSVLLDGTILDSRAISNAELEEFTRRTDRCGEIHRVVENIHEEFSDLIADTFPPLNRCLTGYDLAHIREQNGDFNLNNILCGSEGTLGFIVEATLNVLPIPKCSSIVIVKYDNFQSALQDATRLMQATPTSIETIDSKVLNLAMKDFIWHQVETFFADKDERLQGINLVEFTADSETELENKISALTTVLDSSLDNSSRDTDPNEFGRLGYVVANGHEAVNKIWAMRKRAVGLLGNIEGEQRPIPFVEDTAVPPEHLADFIMEFREILDAYNLNYGMFGHVDAGVLHVRPALDMKDPDQEEIAWEISDRIADLTLQYHGLLWGEHGKGVRSEYAPKFFGPLYPQLQRIKRAFDPRNQLNPGKIATIDSTIELLKIDEVPTRGQKDRNIATADWQTFNDAVYCNGNGACFNWNPQDAMCPSWKGTRERVNSPKGRASLIREWLTLLAEKKVNLEPKLKEGKLKALVSLPLKTVNSFKKIMGQSDFSHEVYDSMAACLACKSCAGQCPIKVDVPEFRSKFLAIYHTRYLRPLKDYLVASLENLLPLAAMFPRSYNFVMRFPPSVWLLKKLVGFVDGPALSGVKLKSADFPIATPKKLNKLGENERAKVVVVVQDAFTRYFETPLIVDIFELLRALGFTPMLAPFKANGKPQHVHGFLKAFARVAKKNAKMLNALADCGVSLVGVDPSMTLTYRGEYLKYLKDIPAPKVSLLQEWLVNHLDTIRQIESPEKTLDFNLLPHCTEASNAAGTLHFWSQIFEAAGHKLKIENAGCCGMSGTYGHEARNRETSQKIYTLSWQKFIDYTDRDIDNINLTIATGYSCRSQVKRESKVLIAHPAQVLLKLLKQ